MQLKVFDDDLLRDDKIELKTQRENLQTKIKAIKSGANQSPQNKLKIRKTP
jgi:hypothetical protein